VISLGFGQLLQFLSDQLDPAKKSETYFDTSSERRSFRHDTFTSLRSLITLYLLALRSLKKHQPQS